MSETIDPCTYFDSNLICDECQAKKCTLVSLNLEQKLCENCSHKLEVETISASILNNVKTQEQFELYLKQKNAYDVLSDLLDNMLSQYDVALETLESLYEERCSWIKEFFKENQELLNIFLLEFTRDRDEILRSIKNQLTSDNIDPYSLEMAAYTNYQNILGAGIISSIHDNFNKLVAYVTNTMRFEWSNPYDLISLNKIQFMPQDGFSHKIQFISTRSDKMYDIDVLNIENSQTIIIKGWDPAKQASWIKLPSGIIFHCGGIGKWMLRDYIRKKSSLLFPSETNMVWDKQAEMQNKRAKHAIEVFDNDLYILGGKSNTSGFDMIEKFNLNTQKWVRISTPVEVLGSASSCKIQNGILIAGKHVPNIYLFDPATEDITTQGWIAGKKILLKSNDAIYCLADRSLYKSSLNYINFILVKNDLECNGNWWMPSKEICVGTKIFFINEHKGVGELWELDISTSDYNLRKHNIRLY